MTDQEKQQLKDELMKEVLSELNRLEDKDHSKQALQEVREKWFKGKKMNRLSTFTYESTMEKAFGKYIPWKVWDEVRRITCRICGAGRLTNLADTTFANYAADKLCQTIYDLRVEYMEKYGGANSD